jgi:DNA polymerase-1
MSKGKAAHASKLVLIDGHALAYRAYFALPPTLSTSKGELTNAVFGFTSMLLNVLRDEKPDYIAVTFDVGKTFRHEEYKEYKAHRVKMPDEMRTQMARIQEIVRALSIPIIEVEGYEADDVLGTLAQKAEQEGVEILIVTGDTDTFQLIDEHTRVLTSRRAFSDTVVYDQEGIEERYGLHPHQLIDYKALVGDTSDNIPGVRGVGEKTATRLLQRYGSVEEIYAHLDEVKSTRFRKALEQGRESAFLSKFLATIVTDVPAELDLEACRTSEFDQDKVKELFRELEFRTLLNRLPERERQAHPQQLSMFGEAKEEKAPTANYQVVEDEKALKELVARLSKAAAITLDVETTSTDAMVADLVGIALTDREGEGYYIPIGHEEVGTLVDWETGKSVDSETGRLGNQSTSLPVYQLEKLRPVLEDESIAKYAHNSKYDLTVLVRHGMQVKGLSFDTMIAEWLADPASRNLGLKNLAWARLGVEMQPITDLIGTGKAQITIAQVPIAQAAPYACADVDMTHRLVKVLEPELREKELWPLFTEVEMPLVPVLVEMEMKGVKLDVEYLEEMSGQLQGQLGDLEREIQEMVGYSFNVNSTQQLSDALFIKLGLSAQGVQKTKSGHYSTAANVLEKLKGQHPVIELILEQRELAKLKSTYVDALPQLVNERTGRVHTSYNQTGTVTGRISSSDPNLQNIPIRTEVGREVRRAFVAEEGSVLLAADYSQVELRVLAHISQDPAMLDTFARGEDIHTSTAAFLFDVPLSEVDREMRRVAKSINFGITYGMSGYGMAWRTGLSQQEATRFIEGYFSKYSRVKAYLDETKRKAREQGYVETLLGRRRYFPELRSGSRAHQNVRASAQRMAINAPIQGSAADIIKIAMIRLHHALKERGSKSGMTLQVHDELVLEVPEGELDVVAPLVKSIMEGAFQLDAPLKVDMKVGRNWLEME